jgi:hypothetical protein
LKKIAGRRTDENEIEELLESGNSHIFTEGVSLN